jgi:hypothetical protein
MIGLVFMAVVVLLLFGIFVRTKKPANSLFDRPCPHCRTRIPDRATVCRSCGRETKFMTMRDRLWSK